jgi:hypothetical protein
LARDMDSQESGGVYHTNICKAKKILSEEILKN